MTLRILALLILPIASATAQDLGVYDVLTKPILARHQPTLEVQVYTGGRVIPLRTARNAAEWEADAARFRQEVLDKVILRGEAARWKDAKTRVEWLDTLPGNGYRVRKLRYEAFPGLWIPALLYEPEKIDGKVPVVLNVNGHETAGVATPYIQVRCINLAKRGMLALNFEWVGKGQLNLPGFEHTRMNQIDLCGTSGVAVHYLAQKRALDLLLSLEHADPNRVAVTGLSGGGWQTIIISSLDTRVRLADPVAGYSSFVTRTQFPELDLGDSEQTPTDLGTVVDYTHLTAMLAPRPTLLTNNALDSCCFRADYTVSPLLSAARPVFALFGKAENLHYHINFDPGHNYGADNREAFYRMLRDYFYDGSKAFPLKDIPSENEVRTAAQLRVELPSGNTSFHQIAMDLSRQLPRSAALPQDKASAARWQEAERARLREVVRAKQYEVETEKTGEEAQPSWRGLKASYWRLKMDEAWTVPAVELVRGDSKSTVILVADGGRASVAMEAERLVSQGYRVLAMDPFYFGESAIERGDWLFAILTAALGDRPLGLQASQVAAAARWLEGRGAGPVMVVAAGPRSSLFALVAAALEPGAISGLRLYDSLGSLKEVIERNITVREAPELFCFGLLESFDIKQLTALVAPRPVAVIEPSERAKSELGDLKHFYSLLGRSYDPLNPR